MFCPHFYVLKIYELIENTTHCDHAMSPLFLQDLNHLLADDLQWCKLVEQLSIPLMGLGPIGFAGVTSHQGYDVFLTGLHRLPGHRSKTS